MTVESVLADLVAFPSICRTPNGAIVAHGAPAEIVTAELVEHIFGIACVVIADPVSGTPMIVPGRSAAAG
mgnify:CR=1 FL=1